MNKFIMYSFPLIMICVFLTGGVSKPAMPHITLPEMHRAPPSYDTKDASIIDRMNDLQYTIVNE